MAAEKPPPREAESASRFWLPGETYLCLCECPLNVPTMQSGLDKMKLVGDFGRVPKVGHSDGGCWCRSAHSRAEYTKRSAALHSHGAN